MSKTDKLIEKYSQSNIGQVTLKKLIDGDKTPTKKYAEKIIQYYISRRSLGDKRQADIFRDIIKFEELLPYIENKDIYNTTHYPVTGYTYLTKAIKEAEEIKEEKTFVRENHATVLFENDDFLLLRPLTHRGSLKYGANTKWCTASKTSPSTFERYIQSNYLFYLIRKNQKNTKWDKVAFLFRKSQEVFGDCSMYDANDNCCSDSSLKKSDWSIVDIIKFETICRIFCAQQREIERARSVVNHFKTSVLEYDFDELNRSMEVLRIKIDENFYNDLKEQIEIMADKLKIKNY